MWPPEHSRIGQKSWIVPLLPVANPMLRPMSLNRIDMFSCSNRIGRRGEVCRRGRTLPGPGGAGRSAGVGIGGAGPAVLFERGGEDLGAGERVRALRQAALEGGALRARHQAVEVAQEVV